VYDSSSETIKGARIALNEGKYFQKGENMHNCPICGELTAGTVSEGGVLFSVCEECYKGRYQLPFLTTSKKKRKERDET